MPSGASQRSSRRAALMLNDAGASAIGDADDAAAAGLSFAAGGAAAAALHMDDTLTTRGSTARAGSRPQQQQGKSGSHVAPSPAAPPAPSPPPAAAAIPAPAPAAAASDSLPVFSSTLKLRTSMSTPNASGGLGGGGIAGLSSLLTGNTVPSAPQAMQSVRSLHTSVQATLGTIQTKTSLILQEQERDLLRSFQTRLGEVVAELERERKKNESGSIEWVQRCRKLTEELEWLRELTETLSTENKQLLLQNRRAGRAAATQEQDRAFLIKQLVSVKKENARLRFLVEQQVAENQMMQQQQQQQQQQTTKSGGGEKKVGPLQPFELGRCEPIKCQILGN